MPRTGMCAIAQCTWSSIVCHEPQTWVFAAHQLSMCMCVRMRVRVCVCAFVHAWVRAWMYVHVWIRVFTCERCELWLSMTCRYVWEEVLLMIRSMTGRYVFEEVLLMIIKGQDWWCEHFVMWKHCRLGNLDQPEGLKWRWRPWSRGSRGKP
jgi:hypothetical protein